MRRRWDDGYGMETPISMFLLLMAALLISSIGDILLSEQAGGGDLFEIRSVQVRSMGHTLSLWEPQAGHGTLLELLRESEEIRYFTLIEIEDENELTSLERFVLMFLDAVPDNVQSFLIVGPEEDIEVRGEHAEWRNGDDVLIRIILPLRYGSVEVTV